MLNSWGPLNMDVVYADLNIKNVLSSHFQSRKFEFIDESGTKTHILSGPFWPKNQGWGLSLWINRFTSYVEECLSQMRKPDIIHAHTYLGAAVANRISQKLNIPVVVTEHYTGFLNEEIRPNHLLLAKYSYGNSQKVLAVSHALSSGIKKLTGKETLVVPNFVDHHLFRYKKQGAKEFNIVFAGDLIQRKNVSLLIRAFALFNKHYRDSTLTIIGNGPLFKKLKTLVSFLSLENFVTFSGQQNQANVAQLLRSSHLLVLPSLCETFGLVLVEALMSGIPVIATDSGGPSDIIHEKNGILLKELYPDNLSEMIVRIRKNYNHYDHEAIRLDTIKKFSVHAVGNKLMEIYSELI